MITLIAALLIFTGFIGYIVIKYKALESVSASYYKVGKYAFTSFIFSVGLLMGVSGDSAWLFGAGGVLCGVGVASNYKWIREQGIHIFCAVFAIVLGFIGIWIQGQWYLAVAWAFLYVYYIATENPKATWYIECWAFYLIFAGILIEKLTN